MPVSSFCEYSHAYILLKGTMTVVGQEVDAAIASNRNN